MEFKQQHHNTHESHDRHPLKRIRLDTEVQNDHHYDPEIVTGFLSVFNRGALCKFLSDFDVKSLKEFVDLYPIEAPNLKQKIDDAQHWLNAIGHETGAFIFDNEYFIHLGYLSALRFDELLISKEFLDTFQCLCRLTSFAVKVAHFEDDIDCKYIRKSFENNQMHSLQSLDLWSVSPDESNAETDLHYTFANELFQSGRDSINSVTCKLSIQTMQRFEFNKILNLHTVDVRIADKESLHALVNDMGFMTMLKNHQQLRAVTVGLDAIDTEPLHVASDIVQLISLLQGTFPSAVQGKIKILGIVGAEFMDVYQAQNEDIDDDAKPILDSFEMEYLTKQENSNNMIKLFDSNIIDIAKNVRITMADHFMLRSIFDSLPFTIDAKFKAAADEKVNEVMDRDQENLILPCFWCNYLLSKEWSPRLDQNVIYLDKITNDNKDKLGECFAPFLKKWTHSETVHEEQKEAETDDSDFKRFCSELDDNEQELLQQCDGDLLVRATIYRIQAKMLHSDDPMKVWREQQEILRKCQAMQAMEQRMVETKEQAIQTSEQQQLPMSTVVSIAHTDPCAQITRHFDIIYDFIGAIDIKTTLYLVNKKLFQLSAGKIHATFACDIDDSFYWEPRSLRNFVLMEHLDIGWLTLKRKDLYPFSLLRNLQSIRFGMVEYEYDVYQDWNCITTHDIRECFKNWNQLKSINLWHFNNEAGSRYDGNPLSAELTNTLFTSSIKTIERIHVAFYGTKCMWSRWEKKENKHGHFYYEYKHHTDAPDAFCIYPDFSILSKAKDVCNLQEFSFWTRDTNQDIMGTIYEDIKQLPSVQKICIQFESGVISEPTDNMSTELFKEVVRKWTNMLHREEEEYFGELELYGAMTEWLRSMADDDKNDTKVLTLRVMHPWDDVDMDLISPLMTYKNNNFVKNLYLEFITSSRRLDYRSFAKPALMNGFYTKCGDRWNEVILTNITKDNAEELHSLLPTYIDIDDDDDE